jgi:GT2 family glycosyltransferase
LKRVSIITVNFNQPLITELFLNSVANCNTYQNIEIIVVDNGSIENHVPDWHSSFPQVHFIRSEKNLGFAGGNNLGIREASGDYLFLVNNDTEFSPGLIESLVNILDSKTAIGAVSPKILYFENPDIIQYAGFTKMNMNTGRNKCIGQMETDQGQFDANTGPTGFVHGAAMMIRKEAIDKAGLMPELFFLYYEEMDWCEKIRNAGYEIWIEPKARIYHKESMTVGKNSLLKE